MLVGRPPFESNCVKQTYNAIKNNIWEIPKDKINKISPAAQDLLHRIFVLDPSRRYDIYDIEDHPFFNGPGVIPKSLCMSLLAHPPSKTYIDQHEKN